MATKLLSDRMNEMSVATTAITNRIATMPKRMWWALFIGAGIALATEYSVSSGWALVIIGVGLFVGSNWEKVKESWASSGVVKWPMIVMLIAMLLSLVNVHPASTVFTTALIAFSLFGLFFVARVLGNDIFLPLGLGVAVASAGVLVYSVVHPGQVSGGYVFGGNFNAGVGYIILGAVICVSSWRNRYSWILLVASVLALVLSGAPEMLIPLGAIVLALTLRKDWSKKALCLTVSAVAILAILTLTGLYHYTWQSATNDHTVTNATIYGNGDTYSPLEWRYTVAHNELSHIQPLGVGYNITYFPPEIVHNVPLVVVQQLGYPGVLAALAWLFLCVYGLVKTKWKYVWVAIISLSLLDHFIWDQLSPMVWAAAGVSTTVTDSDLLFKAEKAA